MKTGTYGLCCGVGNSPALRWVHAGSQEGNFLPVFDDCVGFKAELAFLRLFGYELQAQE